MAMASDEMSSPKFGFNGFVQASIMHNSNRLLYRLGMYALHLLIFSSAQRVTHAIGAERRGSFPE